MLISFPFSPPSIRIIFSCNIFIIILTIEIKVNNNHLNTHFAAFKLTQKVKDIFESNETINLEQNKLLNDSNTLLQLSNNVTKCCQAIEDTLKNIYPLCKAHPFGSRVTGLGNIVSQSAISILKFAQLNIFFLIIHIG